MENEQLARDDNAAEQIKKLIRACSKNNYSKKENKPLRECEGRIAGDSIMCYPPGIPILAPGELITEEIIQHITYASSKGCSITGIASNGDVCVLI